MHNKCSLTGWNSLRIKNLYVYAYYTLHNFSVVRPGSIDPMTAVVQRVKGFAYYSLSFLRHNKNIKMEHFLLYILSRYFIWLHKWKGFNDICASLKYERMIDYSYQLLLILYPSRRRETISLRGPVFHRSHGHNLVRPGHQSEVSYGYVSKICRKFTRKQSETSNNLLGAPSELEFNCLLQSRVLATIRYVSRSIYYTRNSFGLVKALFKVTLN